MQLGTALVFVARVRAHRLQANAFVTAMISVAKEMEPRVNPMKINLQM